MKIIVVPAGARQVILPLYSKVKKTSYIRKSLFPQFSFLHLTLGGREWGIPD
jgi:hypothetical protein